MMGKTESILEIDYLVTITSPLLFSIGLIWMKSVKYYHYCTIIPINLFVKPADLFVLKGVVPIMARKEESKESREQSRDSFDSQTYCPVLSMAN